MLNIELAEQFNDMKPHKEHERAYPRKNFFPDKQRDRNNNKRNEHEFEAPDFAKPREFIIKPSADLILQPDSCIKIQLSKKIFMHQIGKKYKGEKEENSS